MATSISLSSLSSTSCYLHRTPSLPQQLSGDKLTLRWPSFRLRSPIKSRGFSCRASSVVFRNLDADDFRHPLDRRNTLLLKAIPGLNDFVRALIGSITEQVMLLENIGTSVLVSQNQLPDLHKLMVEAAEILNVEAPDLYVRQNPSPNAYTLAISGKKPFVVIHTSLIELLTQKELQAVIAHELGHLKCDHGVWLTLANILTLGAYTVPGIGGLIAQSMEEQVFRWLRSAELTCDRAALLVAQNPKVVLSVLMKLAGGCPSMADQLNVDAFLEQARSYEKASSSPVGWYLSNAQTRQLSHPLPVLRAREIDEWSRSQEYQRLLNYAAKLNSAQKVQIGIESAVSKIHTLLNVGGEVAIGAAMGGRKKCCYGEKIYRPEVIQLDSCYEVSFHCQVSSSYISCGFFNRPVNCNFL